MPLCSAPAAAATCIPTAVERIVITAAQRAGLEGTFRPTGCATRTPRMRATTGRYLHARPTDSSARYLAV